MNSIDARLNPLEVILVREDLERRGYTTYNLALGNDCIWAQLNQFNLYYVFQNCKIVEVQTD